MASYDLIVIGSGTAAQVAVGRVRAAGWSVAVIDHRPFGGTCALRGCDPKRMLVSGEEAIDVYQELDMSLPGILGYQSILHGNIPYEVPDFRDPAVRDRYRDHNACTNPEVAGDQLLPRCSFPTKEIPDSVYEAVRREWEEKQKA